MHTIIGIFWSFNERRLRALLRLGGQAMLMMLIVLVLGLSLGQIGYSLNTSWGYVLAYLISVIAIIIATWLAGRFLDRRRFVEFGFHFSRSWWVDFGFGLGLGAVLMAGIFLVELLAGWLTITGTFVPAQPGTPFILAILPPIIIFVLVSLQEELLSRGYHLTNLAEGLRLGRIGPRGATIIAVLLSSTIFGLLHAANPNVTVISIFNIALAGIFLALGYILTGELAIPLGLHFTWNFFQGNVFGFPVSGVNFNETTVFAINQGGPELWTGGAFGPEAGIIGLVAILLGMILIWFWVRQKSENVVPLQHKLNWRQEAVAAAQAAAAAPTRESQ